jgi:hypothetical protein
MPRIITKVKNNVKHKIKSPDAGWPSVLADLRVDEAKLQDFIEIVERKIKKGDPWPGDNLASGNSDATPTA